MWKIFSSCVCVFRRGDVLMIETQPCGIVSRQFQCNKNNKRIKSAAIRNNQLMKAKQISLI